MSLSGQQVPVSGVNNSPMVESRADLSHHPSKVCVDFTGQPIIISQDQAHLFTTPVASSAPKRTLISPNTSSENPNKKLLESLSPELQSSFTKSFSQGVLTAFNDPSFINQIAEALLQPVTLTLQSLLQTMVIEQFTPQIEQKVHEYLTNDVQVKSVIEKEIQDSVLKKSENIIDAKVQERTVELTNEIKLLKDTVQKHEDLIEEHEQYSRRTCLKFLNVPVPTEQTIKTFNPFHAIQTVCRENLHVEIDESEISRCHILGTISDKKTTVIVRFIRYYDRQRVYQAKSALRGNENGTMIVEALTKKRQGLVNKLNKARHLNLLDSFWTRDGRIYAKKTSLSDKVIISCDDDIIKFGVDVSHLQTV